MNGAYELHGIEYAYNGTVVLSIDHYVVETEGITALVGPNGCGKSTLLDLLGFLRAPTAGTLDFFGTRARPATHEEFRHRIGYVQQKPYLLNTTVFGNVELGLKLRGAPRQERLQRVSDTLGELGLEHLAARRAHELSGGEAQKVAIARAMVLDPVVLILDEPFSHLDVRFHRELEHLLRSIRKERVKTIVLSTHDQFQAQVLADNVCSLIDGHLIPISVMNLFSGRRDPDRHLFVTDHLTFHIPESIHSGDRLSINSNHLVLSNEHLESSMRNSFRGRIRSIKDEEGQIHVEVDAGETFHAIITKESLDELDVNVGDGVWVSFKSTAAIVV